MRGSERKETTVRFLGWNNPLEKGMATYSSIIAWRIAWTEEPGWPQSMVSQRESYTIEQLTISFSIYNEGSRKYNKERVQFSSVQSLSPV